MAKAFPRHGAWCKFDLKVDGAHITPDDKTLGIYQRSSTDRDGLLGGLKVLVNGEPIDTPEHVVVVRPDGTNLMTMDPDGQGVIAVRLAPADCPGLCEAIVPDDLPRCDRNAHLFA